MELGVRTTSEGMKRWICEQNNVSAYKRFDIEYESDMCNQLKEEFGDSYLDIINEEFGMYVSEFIEVYWDNNERCFNI